MDSIIKIEDLVVGYCSGNQGDYRYNPISCSASKGELIALVGRNGVGKSTLLRSIAKLQKSISGRIEINGLDLYQAPREHLSKIISYIPAEPVHSANTTVRGFVSLARYPYHGWFNSLTDTDFQLVDYAIEVVGLKQYSNKFLDFLSDGERQRAMIAFAIAQDTPVVLMDEPTAFLDLPNKFEVVRLLKEQSLNGKTIILSTHDIQTAFSMVDSIWLMLPNAFTVAAPEDLILTNRINALMEGSKVQFDSVSGQFVYCSQKNKVAGLVCDNHNLRMWTVHALERNGFRVEPDLQAHSIEIEVNKVNNTTTWTVKREDECTSFNSIRDLSMYLKQQI